MSKRPMSPNVMRILKWDVAAAIKSVLMFDVNRILFCDLGKVLRHPALQIVYKAVLGFGAAVMVATLVAILLLEVVTPATEKILVVASYAFVMAFIAPDVRRLYRSSRT